MITNSTQQLKLTQDQLKSMYYSEDEQIDADLIQRINDKISNLDLKNIEKSGIYNINDNELSKIFETNNNMDYNIRSIGYVLSSIMNDNGFKVSNIKIRICNEGNILKEKFENSGNIKRLKNIIDTEIKMSDSLKLSEESNSENTAESFIIQSDKSFNKINCDNIGKLIQFTGVVCRIGSKKPLLSKLQFECTKCKEIITISITNNIYKNPKKCKSICKSKTFTLLDNNSSARDYQEIKLQEVYYESKMPRIIEALIFDDLVGIVTPGDVLNGIGILRAESEEKGLFKLIIDINNIIYNSKVYSYENISRITKIDLNVLINSIFPNIYGNDLIKIGLILGLFSGGANNNSLIRSEAHLLILGDPGLGKSKMLLSVSGLLPKSSYLCGNFTSSSGLTLSISNDPNTGDFMAEAGALVLSDNSICCLDEFDKISNEKCLFEVMENQKVTVAKGGVMCSVQAKTSIFAAANPKNGRYDIKKSLTQNVKFDPGILSRFDLIFILLDNLDETHNRKISELILGEKKNTSDADFILSNLRNNLSGLINTNDDTVIPIEMVREYILFARSNITPILSTQAKNKLKEYYKSNGKTIRDLHSLIRLTKAKAKMELRSIASENDARFIIEIYTKIMKMNKVTVQTNIKERSGFKGFVELINGKSKNIFNGDEIEQMMRECKIGKMREEFIEMLNFKGIIIKKGKDEYKLVK